MLSVALADAQVVFRVGVLTVFRVLSQKIFPTFFSDGVLTIGREGKIPVELSICRDFIFR